MWMDDVTEREEQKRDWYWFLLATVVPLWLCARQLTLDFWFDEQYTLGTFVSKPFSEIVTSYPEPNNHVFYSLLLRPFFLVSAAEPVLRLPSLLFTAGTLLIVFLLGRRFGGVATGCAATATLGLMQFFQNYTMQVRGYSLSMFLAAWLIYLATPADSHARSLRRRVAICLVSAAFVYTLPTNLLFLSPTLLIAIVWTWWQSHRWQAAALELINWATGTLLGVLCYLPIWSDVRQHASRVDHPIMEAW